MTTKGQAIPGRFDGRTALVTGSTRGIGQAIAERFAREGAAVVVTGRTADAGEAVVEGIHESGGEATFVEANMREPTAIERLVERVVETFDGIDVLVNNAAVQTDTTTTEATIDDWDVVVETDFRSYWLCAKHAISHMKPGSSICNVSSNHAFQTMPGIFPYNAVKAGINGMTRAMALDFGPDVRVNTINPGWVEVDRTAEALESRDRGREHVEAIHPLKRIGTPADVAGVATFLASRDASFVTGASLLVDGGRGAVMQDETLARSRQEEDTRT